MGTLYIIGNGFDLIHKLPTRYIDFKSYAGDKIEELYSYIDHDLSDERLWNDFESILGDFNSDEYYGLNCLNTDAESWGAAESVAGDIFDLADGLVSTVKEEFYDWIASIDFDNIPRLMNISSDASYFSFNYTSTLSEVYGISLDKIHFIHGSAKNTTDLIFGHGYEIKIESELDENGDSNRHMYTEAINAAKYPIFAFKKDVNEIIQRNQDYFNSLSDVTNVVVIGHSLNKIDMPYFKKINESADSPVWRVGYHDDRECSAFRARLIEAGVEGVNISIVSNKSFMKL